MISPRKILIVGEFLKEAFPGDTVDDSPGNDSEFWFYLIRRGKDVAHRVRMSREFFDGYDEAGVVTKLNGWNAKAEIVAAGAQRVLLTNAGVHLDSGDGG